MTKFKFDKENEQWVELPDDNKLTKREKVAMAAMQGLCAWDGAWNDETRRAHAKNAVSMADALLKELGENND